MNLTISGGSGNICFNSRACLAQNALASKSSVTPNLVNMCCSESRAVFSTGRLDEALPTNGLWFREH